MSAAEDLDELASKAYKDSLRDERAEVIARIVSLKAEIDASYKRISSGKKLKTPISHLRRELEGYYKEAMEIEKRQQEARRARQLVVKMQEMHDA